jgi:hypothetical protein
MIKTKPYEQSAEELSFWSFEFWSFDIVSNFGFRTSDFEVFQSQINTQEYLT